MATTDTVVGIVGAVLLATIMVAVFVYEYGNAPDGDVPPDGEEGALAAFHAAHPLLNATEDIDGDGTPNYMDSDMDQDGTVDTSQDGALRVATDHQGTTPAPPTTEHRDPVAIVLWTGNQGLNATLTWDVAVSDPLGSGALPALPNLSLTLLGPDGQTAEATVSPAAASGATRTITLTLEEAVPGNYTLVIATTSQTPAPATTYRLHAEVSYGPARTGVDTNPR